MKKVLLSGIKPTGEIHIGNYFGAIKQFVDLQNEYEVFVFVADLHALTTITDKNKIKEYTFNIVATYLACGLDPKKVTLFLQSSIGGEVSELTWIFNCLTTMPYLERAHAYKDAKARDNEINIGLFDYPILMAADILIADADIVPVGSDQKQHVEIARDTASKFNRIWGETFKIPDSLILEHTAIVPGIDGKKMSKSYNNTIPLFGTNEEISKAVMSIITDSTGNIPENVYSIHKLFRSENDLKEIYDENKGKYKILKEKLSEDIIAFVSPMRAKYLELKNNPEFVFEILTEGGLRTQKKSQQKMSIIKNMIGIS